MHLRTAPAPLTPRAIYEEASNTYLQGFVPFVRLTGLVALCVNVFLLFTFAFVSSSPLVLKVTWAVLVSFFAVTMLASAVVLPMAIELRATGSTGALTGLSGLREHGVRFLIPTAPLAIFYGLIIPTWVGIPLVVFLVVRLALVGPAIVVEDSDVTDSHARSWELVSRLWTRTAGVLLGAVAPFIVILAVVALFRLSAVPAFFVLTLAEALVVPFFVIVVLLLFDDYRNLKEGQQQAGSNELPPNTIL